MNLAFDPTRGAAGTPLPGSLRVNRRLAQWLKFHSAGYVEVFSGKVEIGQGILTALAQIVAEELDVSLAKVRMVPASTARSPDEAVTSGSRSIEESGTALRHACAEARAIYLSAAAARASRFASSTVTSLPPTPGEQAIGSSSTINCSSAKRQGRSRLSR